MNKAWLVLTGAFVLLSVTIVGSIAVSYATARTPTPTPPPEIAGQPVPEQFYLIDFNRRYDLHCTLGQNEEKVFHGCKILGFTGKSGQPEPSGYSSRSARAYFENWLVVELADGRNAYLPPNCIKYFEAAVEK